MSILEGLWEWARVTECLRFTLKLAKLLIRLLLPTLAFVLLRLVNKTHKEAVEVLRSNPGDIVCVVVRAKSEATIQAENNLGLRRRVSGGGNDTPAATKPRMSTPMVLPPSAAFPAVGSPIVSPSGVRSENADLSTAVSTPFSTPISFPIETRIVEGLSPNTTPIESSFLTGYDQQFPRIAEDDSIFRSSSYKENTL